MTVLLRIDLIYKVNSVLRQEQRFEFQKGGHI